MIPTVWRGGTTRPEHRSLTAGANALISELGDLVAAYVIESTAHPDVKADRIWREALQLDVVRIKLVLGEISETDAAIWTETGHAQLTRHRTDRRRTIHDLRR